MTPFTASVFPIQGHCQSFTAAYKAVRLGPTTIKYIFLRAPFWLWAPGITASVLAALRCSGTSAVHYG